MRKKNFHARLLHSLKISPPLTAVRLLPFTWKFPPRLKWGNKDRDSIEMLIGELILTGFPRLRLPKPEIVNLATVRLGDCCIAADFPPLRQPKPEIVDRGTVRL